MPRTVFEQKQRKYDRLLMLLRGAAAVGGKSNDDLGAIIGRNRDTVTSRFQRPETLTLGELTRLGRALNIPIEDIRQSIQY